MDRRDGEEYIAYGYGVNSDNRSQSMLQRKQRDFGREGNDTLRVLYYITRFLTGYLTSQETPENP